MRRPVISQPQASGVAPVGDDRARAERGSSVAVVQAERAECTCTDGTDLLHICAARTSSENRTNHSVLAEKSASQLRPPVKARSGLSEELDGAMTRLKVTNAALAHHLGVSEKLVREWRGRLHLAPGEEPKAIPGFQISRLPEELFQEMLVGLRVVHRDQVREARAVAAAKASGGGSR